MGFEDPEEELLRTQEEMRGELRAFIEMHEFPNRIKVPKAVTIVDMNGKSVPPGVTLDYGPHEGVKMKGETIYGLYGDEKNNMYWIRIGDADRYASRVHGYTKARP